MRFTRLQNSLRWTLSFPIFTWRNVPLENCTLRFGPKDFVFFGKIDLDFSGSTSKKTQLNCLELFNEAAYPFHYMYSTFC